MLSPIIANPWRLVRFKLINFNIQYCFHFNLPKIIFIKKWKDIIKISKMKFYVKSNSKLVKLSNFEIPSTNYDAP
jgi:hypothetical protein